MILNYEDKNRVNFNLGVDCREGFGNKRGCGGRVSPHTTNGNLDNSIVKRVILFFWKNHFKIPTGWYATT